MSNNMKVTEVKSLVVSVEQLADLSLTFSPQIIHQAHE